MVFSWRPAAPPLGVDGQVDRIQKSEFRIMARERAPRPTLREAWSDTWLNLGSSISVYRLGRERRQADSHVLGAVGPG
jgi:hypothetical protein